MVNNDSNKYPMFDNNVDSEEFVNKVVTALTETSEMKFGFSSQKYTFKELSPYLDLGEGKNIIESNAGDFYKKF